MDAMHGPEDLSRGGDNEGPSSTRQWASEAEDKHDAQREEGNTSIECELLPTPSQSSLHTVPLAPKLLRETQQ
jgi:hypothetical protein